MACLPTKSRKELKDICEPDMEHCTRNREIDKFVLWRGLAFRLVSTMAKLVCDALKPKSHTANCDLKIAFLFCISKYGHLTNIFFGCMAAVAKLIGNSYKHPHHTQRTSISKLLSVLRIETCPSN